MFGHKVVEDLRGLNPPHGSETYDKIQNELISSIPMTNQFYLGDAYGLAKTLSIHKRDINIQEYFSENILFFKLPYSPLYLEHETSNRPNMEKGGVVEDLRWATLLKEYTDRPNEIFCFLAAYMKSAKQFIHYPVVTVFNTKTTDVKLLKCNFVSENDITTAAGMTILVIASVIILNCKNIIYKKVHPDKALNTKRIKNKKLPLFEYHSLKFQPLEEIIYGQNRQYGKKKLASKRVHLCRGHFKTYTEEKPLMGKHTGLYWWEPHVRGDKKAGLVLKDYEINCAENI